MNLFKKYLGDPDVMQYLDFEKSDHYKFSLDGQRLEFLSPDYSCEISPVSANSNVHLSKEHWLTENSTIGPYQQLFRSSWKIYNQKRINKIRMGGVWASLLLRYRPEGIILDDFRAIYSHINHSIAEHYRISGGGMINRVEGYWTHEVTYSEKENDFCLLNNNGLNWLCGYKLSEGFIENSFYHTLLNEDVVIELKFSRSIDCGHSNRPAVIEAMNAAERDFIRHFKLEPKENTLAIQNMLAEQYKGKVLTLNDIGSSSERALLDG